MVKFAYNNAKNASTGHIPFEFNCGYHPRASYEEDVDPHSQSKSADKLATKFRKLMAVCRENLQHVQELQKWYHDKHAKPRSYAPGTKVWLNSKYIKTKQNRKLEAKFFGPFRVLHPVGKQAYKIELLKKWRIHNVFYVSLLEHDTTKKKRVDKTTFMLQFENDGNGKKYKVEAICDSVIYAKELDSGHHLPGLYYLVSWKSYLEEKNTWEPATAVLHLCKIISTSYLDHSEKPTVTSLLIDSAPPIVRPTVKFRAEASSKQKQGRPAEDSSISKRTKKTWTSSILSRFLALSQ